MSEKLGTPNQKSVYSVAGNNVELCQELINDTPRDSLKQVLKLMDRQIKYLEKQNAVHSLELMRSKISGEPIRSFERKEEVMERGYLKEKSYKSLHDIKE